jgi:hypothetical protein
LTTSFGASRHGVEKRRPHSVLLKNAQSRGGRAARRGDLGAKDLRRFTGFFQQCPGPGEGVDNERA